MLKRFFTAILAIIILSSCGQNTHLTLNKSNSITSTSISINTFSSFQYTYDQNNSIPDLSWQIIDNNTGAPYNGVLEYEYAIGTDPINILSEVHSTSAALNNIKNWLNSGSNLPFLGAGVEGLPPGIYYINLKAFIPISNLLVATDFVRFEVLASGSMHPAVTLLSPSSGAVAQAGSSITLSGTCTPNATTITVSGSDLNAPNTGTCNNGIFSIPVSLSNSLIPGSQPTINVSINSGLNEASANIVLNVPKLSVPLLAILGPNTNTYQNPTGMGPTSPQEEFLNFYHSDSIAPPCAKVSFFHQYQANPWIPAELNGA
jgi:hypothetical protein